MDSCRKAGIKKCGKMKTDSLSDVSSSEREMEDDQFVECSMAMQDFLMILLEICMILELALLLVRITCFSGKKENRNSSGYLCCFFCIYGRSDE